MLDSFASPEFHSYGNSWRHVTTIVIMSSSTLFNSPTHSFGPVDYMDMLVSCIVRIIHLLVEYFGQKNKTCSSEFFTYSEYDPSYYFSSKTSLLSSTILIYISNVVIDHFQHTGNEFTGHCFVDEFLLRYLSISVDVNNLQNLFCSFVQNIIGNLRSKVNCDHGDDSGIHLHPNHCIEA